MLDFGDLSAGDPATDMASVIMLLPPSVRGTFAATYGPSGRDLELRALGWAIHFGTLLLTIGLEGRPSYVPVSTSTVAGAIGAMRPH